MNLFNQNYHIQIHMHKLQLEKKLKKKKITKTKTCKKDFRERLLVYTYISFEILIIDF